MRISIDRELCCSSGHCVLTVPDVFDQDDDGLAVALVANPPSGLEAKVQQAADTCPAGAISLIKD